VSSVGLPPSSASPLRWTTVTGISVPSLAGAWSVRHPPQPPDTAVEVADE
jgi:hypothetical protein